MQTNKKLLRGVIRQVHPDLFNSLPYERSHNSDNLKLLNDYVDQLANRRSPRPVKVSFWTKGSLKLELVTAELDGSLGNLFLAFSLISKDEWRQMQMSTSGAMSADDTNFLDWLRETVADAVATADEHEYLKKIVREMKAAAEFNHGLAAVRVGNTYSSTTVDLKRQMECLRVLETFLLDHGSRDFDGLTFHLYHPWSAPSQTYHWMDADGNFRMEASVMNANIASDGALHVIADRSSFKSQIDSLNLTHAKALAKVNDFWGKRQRDLLPGLRQVLRVQNVWCDNRNSESQEQFVLWAGRIMNAKAAFQEALEGRCFKFSVLVHSDETSPLIDYMSTSSVLQIRSDCAPQLMQQFLVSETADEADEAAHSVKGQKDEEESLLEQVKEVFGAKHVIRVCSTEDKTAAMEAARRLLADAAKIQSQVNLTNASIAIDDCYQVWESGFISIPYDFEVNDLRPKLSMLMAADTRPSASERDRTSGYGDSDSGLDTDGYGGVGNGADAADLGSAYHGGSPGAGGDYVPYTNGAAAYNGARDVTAAAGRAALAFRPPHPKLPWVAVRPARRPVHAASPAHLQVSRLHLKL